MEDTPCVGTSHGSRGRFLEDARYLSVFATLTRRFSVLQDTSNLVVIISQYGLWISYVSTGKELHNLLLLTWDAGCRPPICVEHIG